MKYTPIRHADGAAVCDVCSVELGCCLATGNEPGWGQVFVCVTHEWADTSWKDFTRDEWAHRHEKTPV